LKPLIAIACGGTGGHLFPGLAVARQIVERGCDVTLLVSPKEVDQQGVRSVTDARVVTLPAVGLARGQFLGFVRGFWKSYRAAKRLFAERAPQAVLGMGGFTSAPPVLAGRGAGAATFLHESNTIPGRANRWIARVVDQAFVGFPSAAGRLRPRHVITTGTPVRPQFQPGDAGAARVALGLAPERPVLLVMGGSQGAAGVNELALAALPRLALAAPGLQVIHLTGAAGLEKARAAYASQPVNAVVFPFLAEMDKAMAAATVAVSRSGASSLAELAALRLPSVLVPYPVAADNHQFHNARAFVETGAALMLEERNATGAQLADLTAGLLHDAARRQTMAAVLARWHSPDAAWVIAETMLECIRARRGGVSRPAPATVNSISSSTSDDATHHRAGQHAA
jgi:UDP-N-acetylglucosamine--N-acetylmuramyl-(pentapeptide) pyrophosphoryl-undecaprenol N-acetylglucosamine transferase